LDTWKKYGEKAHDHMSVLNSLQMVQIRPLLLAVLDTFEPAEVGRVMLQAISWSVRFLVVGGLGGGTIEREYAGKARDIRDGQIKSATALAEAMKTVVPSDVVFRAAFETVVVTKPVIARYYLRVLEEVANGDTNPPLVTSERATAVNLEHILPQNPSGEWSHIEAETAKAFYNRLGNLTLMRAKRNADVQNFAFASKITEYAKEPFLLTKEVSKQSEWNESQIEKRQQRLSALAVSAWKV
jgi:hypothetical protein